MLPIPSFPQFRALMATDRAAIEAFCGRFPPYSDFGFTSLYAWNTDQSCAIAMLNDNLVLRLKDYETDQHFLTFLGRDRVIETVQTLLAYARLEGLPAELRLVPETVITADPELPRQFAITADSDNFDYLYRVEDWMTFAASVFREHRRLVARCRDKADVELRPMVSGDCVWRESIEDLFMLWTEQKSDRSPANWRHERAALQRVFDLVDDRIETCGFYDCGRLVGFCIWEGLPGGRGYGLPLPKGGSHDSGTHIVVSPRARSVSGSKRVSKDQLRTRSGHSRAAGL